jgi:hypothetical protein
MWKKIIIKLWSWWKLVLEQLWSLITDYEWDLSLEKIIGFVALIVSGRFGHIAIRAETIPSAAVAVVVMAVAAYCGLKLFSIAEKCDRGQKEILERELLNECERDLKHMTLEKKPSASATIN